MKKIIIWTLCVSLLCGCSPAVMPTEPAPAETGSPTEAVTEPRTEPVTEPTETLPTPTEPAAERADHEICRLDRSVRNEAGEVIILFYYDRVILGEGEEFRESNRILEASAEAFLEEIPIDELIDWAQQMDIGPEYPFLCNVTAEVTHNDNGIFSMKLARDWYAGGVHNLDYEGMTFDLRADRAVTLTELFPEEADVIVSRLKTLVWAELAAMYGQSADAEMWDKLQAYEAEEFLFYIEDGELILTFPTYTFGSGADGAMTLPTGQYIGE